MPLFRKRPVDVEMVQYNGLNLAELQDFAGKTVNRLAGTPNLTFYCAASQSQPVIGVDDWIARERDGSGYYLIREAEQAATYERVYDDQAEHEALAREVISKLEADVLWTIALKGQPLGAKEATQLCAWVLARVAP